MIIDDSTVPKILVLFGVPYVNGYTHEIRLTSVTSCTLKWKDNSCNIQSLVKDVLNKGTHSVSIYKLDIQTRASLETSTIIREISKRVVACLD